MALRIDDRSLAAGLAQSRQLQQSHAVKRYGELGASVPGAATGDRVDLSSLADRISAHFDNDEASSAARVDRLSALVRSGEYSVDSLAIAKGLVGETLLTQ